MYIYIYIPTKQPSEPILPDGTLFERGATTVIINTMYMCIYIYIYIYTYDSLSAYFV